MTLQKQTSQINGGKCVGGYTGGGGGGGVGKKKERERERERIRSLR